MIFLMSTLQEIKSAIGNLNARDKALLAAELFAIIQRSMQLNWRQPSDAVSMMSKPVGYGQSKK